MKRHFLVNSISMGIRSTNGFRRCLGTSFMFLVSRYPRETCFWTTRFILVPRRPMGFCGRLDPPIRIPRLELPPIHPFSKISISIGSPPANGLLREVGPPDSHSPTRVTPDTPFLKNLDFHWFPAGQWASAGGWTPRFAFPDSSYPRYTLSQKSRFPLVPRRPMGFCGRLDPPIRIPRLELPPIHPFSKISISIGSPPANGLLREVGPPDSHSPTRVTPNSINSDELFSHRQCSFDPDTNRQTNLKTIFSP